MAIQPNEMQEMQQKSGKENSGGVTKLAQDIAQKLVQFKDLVDSSKATTDKDRQAVDSLLQQFVMIVEKQLAGSEPGYDMQEEQSEDMGAVPMEAGLKGVPMGPQTRQ